VPRPNLWSDDLLASVESRLSRHALDVYARVIRATLDAVGEAVLLADAQGDVLLANRPFAELAGLGPEYRLELRDARAALTALGAVVDEAELRALLQGAGVTPRTLEIEGERAVLCTVTRLPLSDHGGGYRVLALRDVTQERRELRELEHRALHDALSGLPGRDLLMDRLERALARQAREGGAVGVVFLDLDRFKDVNDRFGHAAGDRTLVEVAARLQQELRDADTVGRLGGDEFLIVCDGLDSEATLDAICERIQARIAEPYHLEALEVALNASLGAILEWDTAVAPARLIESADALMYAAKRRRSRREIFVDGRPRTLAGGPAGARRPLATQQIREAVDGGQLFFAFLPIVSLADGHTIAVEGLLRCSHPALRAATPAQLLDLLEQARVIERFDEWALDQAASAARALLDANAAKLILARHREIGDPVRVVLNLSAAQLAHPAVSRAAGRAASEHGIDAELLSFDIAEGLLDKNPPWLQDSLASLRALGCRLVVDDVTAPDVAAARLRDDGFDGFKLDRPVIGRIVEDPDFAMRAKAAVAAARAAGFSVTGEGVDDERRLRAVRELGCDSAQGFGFYGFPRAVAQLVKLVGEGDPVIDGGDPA
jgi:diguanylate cyclase (GGDEF)-like protein